MLEIHTSHKVSVKQIFVMVSTKNKHYLTKQSEKGTQIQQIVQDHSLVTFQPSVFTSSLYLMCASLTPTATLMNEGTE